MSARFAETALVALLLSGCGGPASAPAATNLPATVEGALGDCARYADLPDAYGYCLATFAAGLATVADMERLCEHAGTWEGACRDGWVEMQSRRADPPPATALLAACGDNADCAFRIIDTGKLADDVLGDIGLCHAHVNRYEADCVSHALDRWVRRRPDAAELARVRAGAPNHPVRVGWAAGVLAACVGNVTCEDEATPFGDACRAGRATYQDGGKSCPVR